MAKAEAADCTLDKLALSTMQEVDSRVTEGALSVLTPEYSVSSRRSYGGTAPQVVGEAIERATERWL
ncbi:Argininosuccinate lyase 1 [compost metagenome]